MSNLVSPLLWQSVPFKDNDAWLDFLGAHEQWHRELAKATKTRIVPLDDLREQLQAHDQLHRDLADALGISRAGDLSSFDLNEEAAYTGWTWIHALDHQRFRLKAGL